MAGTAKARLVCVRLGRKSTSPRPLPSQCVRTVHCNVSSTTPCSAHVPLTLSRTTSHDRSHAVFPRTPRSYGTLEYTYVTCVCMHMYMNMYMHMDMYTLRATRVTNTPLVFHSTLHTRLKHFTTSLPCERAHYNSAHHTTHSFSHHLSRRNRTTWRQRRSHPPCTCQRRRRCRRTRLRRAARTSSSIQPSRVCPRRMRGPCTTVGLLRPGGRIRDACRTPR